MLPPQEKKLIEYLYAAKKIIDDQCLDCNANKCNPVCLWHQMKEMCTLIFKAAQEKEKQKDIIEGLF